MKVRFTDALTGPVPLDVDGLSTDAGLFQALYKESCETTSCPPDTPLGLHELVSLYIFTYLHCVHMYICVYIFMCAKGVLNAATKHRVQLLKLMPFFSHRGSS